MVLKPGWFVSRRFRWVCCGWVIGTGDEKMTGNENQWWLVSAATFRAGRVAQLLACSGLVVGITTSARGADDDTPRRPVLRLRTGDVVTSAPQSVLAAQAFKAGVRYVLGVDGPLSPERRATLVAAGVVIEDYLGGGYVLARFAAAATPVNVRAAGLVTWAGEYQDAWKIDPDLAGGVGRPARAFLDTERQLLEARGDRVVCVYLFEGEPVEATADMLRVLPGVVVRAVNPAVGVAMGSVVISIPAAAISGLAGVRSARFVEEVQEFESRDLTAQWVVQSNVPDSTPFHDHGITGVGQVVGVIDSQVDTNHCAFKDAVNPIGPNHRKILAYNASIGAVKHGTHVAGLAVGDSGLDDDLRGIAYGAKMVYNLHPQATEASFIQRFTLHNSQGAFIHNNSWGTEATKAYDGSCRGIDSYCWANDDNLVLFAVSDFALLKNPENAKNCLAVAAVGDAPNQDSYCVGGIGPTTDGRRKPEIMGPGCDVTSARFGSACLTLEQSGTSMATPIVAGTAVLLRQYFTEGFYPSGSANASDGFVPSGPLLKAALLNSAVDVPGMAGFPGLNEGWGRVLLDDAAYFAGDTRRLVVRQAKNNTAAALTTGQTMTMQVWVRSGVLPLKVTMVFHDAPGAINTAFAPVNDLDLAVVNAEGTAYLGNDFADGVSTVGGTSDAINNVEQVLVPNPAPGVYTVQISAPAVNVGQQGYGLVVTGDVLDRCPADFNGDGFVTGDDYDAYAQVFGSGDAAADMDGDGFVTSDDFDVYVVAFVAGC